MPAPPPLSEPAMVRAIGRFEIFDMGILYMAEEKMSGLERAAFLLELNPEQDAAGGAPTATREGACAPRGR
jgi:hypothetical protein